MFSSFCDECYKKGFTFRFNCLCRSIPKYHRSVFVTYMYHIKPWFSVLIHTRTNFKAFKRLLIGYKNQILNKKLFNSVAYFIFQLSERTGLMPERYTCWIYNLKCDSIMK